MHEKMKSASIEMFLAAAVAAFSGEVFAEGPEAAFAAPFTSHAVLQRDCPLPVWGTAAPGAEVGVALDVQVLRTTAGEDGVWRVEFPPQRQPGLGHSLVLSVGGSIAATLDDVAIGDVWLCSGQSNMDMPYHWGLTRGKEDIETVRDPMMRLFDDHNAASVEPLAALSKPAEWTASDFAYAKNFSACGWFFGQALRKAMPDVPIGLVEATWSGSPIRTWLSKEAYCGADPACPPEYARNMKNVADYEARGGKAEFEKRMERWKADNAGKSDIHAEAPDFDDSGWKTASLPVSFEKQFDSGFDGCVWYRREVVLSAAQAAAADAALSLGPIDDRDSTYVNGVAIGALTEWTTPRNYKIPAGVLREGRNVIAVKAVDDQGGGGFWGKPEQMFLALGPERIPLAGPWRTLGFRYDPKPVSGEVNCWIPTACYNAMLHPLFPMALKGAIWYQGCSDVGNAPLYDRLFRAMAADWRAHFTHQGGMPIYLVQLAAYKETHANPSQSNWADMRWTHMKLGETLENSGTAVAIDIGDHTNIHPKDKKTVGERLARLALARTYGKDIVEAGPIPLRIDRDGGRLVVSFKNAAGLATSDGGPVKGFQIQGVDGASAWADATIEGETVAVTVPEGVAPKFVRYAWDDYPVCNLVNGEALPAGPFSLEVPPPPATGPVEVSEFVPADGQTDAAGAIQALIDANPHRTLHFADGVYLISHPIATPADPARAVSLRLDDFAVLRAAPGWAHKEAMVRLGGIHAMNDNRSFGSVYGFFGGNIDGAGTADGLSIESGRETRVQNVAIKNCRIGIHVMKGANGGSADCDIRDIDMTGNNAPDSVGLLVEAHDNTFTNFRHIDFRTGVKVRGGGNLFTNLHPLASRRSVELYPDGTVGFDDNESNNSYVRCYSDHFSTGWLFGRGSNNADLDGCICFWYDSDPGRRHNAFRCEGKFRALVDDMWVGFRNGQAVNSVLLVGEPGGHGVIRDIRVSEGAINDPSEAFRDCLKGTCHNR